MAGRSARSNNWAPGSPATRYEASGKNREFYTFENAPGLGNYATGGTIIDGGDGYIYHIFTGDGTFAVNRPPAAIDGVDYLIVAGGGGRISSPVSTGGGAGGGFLFGNVVVSNAPGSYPVDVGAGGPPTSPGNGSPSSAFSIIAIAFGPFSLYAGGGGGGAGGSGSQGSTGPPAIGGVGGPGRIEPNFPMDIVSKAISATAASNISSYGYAAGGDGGPTPSPRSRTSPSNSGFGGTNGGLAGGSGIVCVRYKKNCALHKSNWWNSRTQH